MAVVRAVAQAFAWSGAALFVLSLIVFLYSYFVALDRVAPRGAGLRDTVINIGLFTAFAVHHSLFARTGVKSLMSRLLPAPLERSIYVWVASLLFIAVCVLWRPLPGELYRLDGGTAMFLYGIQALAIILTIIASSALGVLDLAGIDRMRADGPPHPTSDVPLHTSGLYGFVRHPIYFSWALLVFATPHMTMTRLVFAVVSCAYLAVAIPFEERGLLDQFGDEYRRYQRRVKWRMLPGVY